MLNTDDWGLYDGLEQVIWTGAADGATAEVSALGRVISGQESGGIRIGTTGRDWNLRAADLPRVPSVGDLLRDESGVHWVLESVEHCTFRGRYKCRTKAAAAEVSV